MYQKFKLQAIHHCTDKNADICTMFVEPYRRNLFKASNQMILYNLTIGCYIYTNKISRYHMKFDKKKKRHAKWIKNDIFYLYHFFFITYGKPVNI